MKILAFSDIHLSAPHAAALVTAAADGADLVIGAGDFGGLRCDLDRAMDMLSGITAPIVAVPGNVESVEELRAAALPNMTVLHGEAMEHAGLRLFGLGYAVPPPPFGDWSCNLDEDGAAAMLARCDGADILITHSPPHGIGDRLGNGVSVGSQSILDAITRLQPRLALFGHIHEGWGDAGQIGNTWAQNLGPTPNWFEV